MVQVQNANHHLDSPNLGLGKTEEWRSADFRIQDTEIQLITDAEHVNARMQQQWINLLNFDEVAMLIADSWDQTNINGTGRM